MTTEITTLSSGLRIVTDFIPTVETVSLGVWLNVGARHEPKEINGVSHMLEHMAFKGTERRSAREIAEVIENVGGYVNAYTSREATAYYVRMLKDDAPLGVDILADILQNSTFQMDEFSRERSVILQEIGQTYDTPDDIVFDYFQETCFPDQPMGRSVLGTPEVINSLTPEIVKAYMKDHYGAKQMVLAAAGNIDHAQFVKLAEEHFTNLTADCAKTLQPSVYKGGRFHEKRDLEQIHVLLGYQGLPHRHEDYYAASLLATILGGGMSSRLFQEIREKRGLVYSIYAYHHANRDTGIFGVYAGTSAEKAKELVDVATSELHKIETVDISQDLGRAKAQLKASLMMSLESTSARCEQLANQMHIYGRPILPQETLAKVEAVTEKQIQDLARRVFSSPSTLTTLGPGEGI